MITARDYYNQLFAEATTAHQSGDLPKAMALYKQLTKDMSTQPEPYHRLALIQVQKGQYREAVSWFEKSIELDANNPAYNNNFAETLQRLDENKRAVALLRKALLDKPEFFEAKLKLAVILKKTAEYEEASQLLKELIHEQPAFYPAFFQLGTLLLETGNYKSAKEHLKTAVDLNPQATKALNNLAIAHQEWEEFDEAISYYTKALEVDPDYIDGVRNLALIYEKVGQLDQAQSYWQKFARLKDNDPLIHWKSKIVEPSVYTSNTEIDRFREKVLSELAAIKEKKINIDVDQLTQLDCYPPAGLIYHGRDDIEIKKKYGQLFRGIPQVKLPPKTDTKPHIGFVVTSGHEGVFIKCMRGLLNKLSTDKFKITIVCSFPNGEKIVRPAVENPSIQFLSLPKSLGQGVQLLASINLDLLYYWEVGTDTYNYFIPYFKPARIQCTSWGWPTTSGIPTMDYFVSCIGLDESSNQKDYTEKLVLFNKLPMYYHPPEIPDLNRTRKDFGIDENCNLYLCAQNVKKVHPDLDELIRGILEKDSKGIVVFLGDKQATAMSTLEQRVKNNCGDHADRVMVIERQDKDGYFNLLNLADVILDTIHYNGGANTNGDAFALNKPIVTKPTAYHRGRYTATAYRQMGMEDLIAESNEQYVDLAVRIANDPSFAQNVSNSIADKKHKFFEDNEAVLEFENFIISAVETSNGLPKTQDETLKQVAQYKNDERYHESLDLMDSFLRDQPMAAMVWMEKGNVHKLLRQLKSAFDAFNKARQLDTANPEILKRFAELLSDLGKNEDAFIAYKRALDLSPEDPEILNNFGGLLLENRQIEEAIPLLKKSGELDSDQLSAFVNLGLAFESLGDSDAAKKVYANILNRLPKDDLFRLHIDTLCPNVAQSKDQIDSYQSQVKETLQSYNRLVGDSLSIDQIDRSYAFPSFSLTYQGKNVKEIKSLWGAFYANRIQPVQPGPKNSKPKVGFLVTQSHEGVFMKDAGGIIKNISSEKFDLIVLANGTEAIKNLKAFIGREDISYVSFSRGLKLAVEEISSINLDFLYYWEIGSDSLNYFLPYFQLARIQISSWGSAFTSGNPRVQYYWSSLWLENDDYPDHYTEEVVLFENLPTYYYRIAVPDEVRTRADLGLPADKRIYLCAQSMSKIHPDFDRLINGILEGDDKAIICLTTPKQEALVSQLLERLKRSLGEQLSRIKVLDKMAHHDYLQLIRLADVCLDSPHYSGANTTYETLQMGIPVVTIPGPFQRGKYTEAVYRILELEDFIPQTQEEYVQLAIEFANNEALKLKFFEVYQKNAHRLFEQIGIVEEIESFMLNKF